MLGLFHRLIPLVNQADGAVSRRLPSVARALDSMFSSVMCDFKSHVSKATSGAFVDPSQDAEEMVLKAKHLCTLVHRQHATLQELARSIQNVQGETV